VEPVHDAGPALALRVGSLSGAPEALAAARLELRRGQVWRLETLTDHLVSVGFEQVEMVEDVAQFAVRGGRCVFVESIRP
jgi:transcription-repair coupling factor (superfamily II helicase)